MGTWDAGPFDNDAAADFGGDLDDRPVDERVAVIRAALSTAAAETGYLDGDDGAVAVAAAAIVAAQCPAGQPTDPIYGPKQPVPPLPGELRPLAVQALDRVLGEDSELEQLWGAGAENWREEIQRLVQVLSAAPA